MASRTENNEINEGKTITEWRDESYSSVTGASAGCCTKQITDNGTNPAITISFPTANSTKPRLADSSASRNEEMFSKLSRINGAINKMTKEQLQAKLAEFRLNTSGVKDVLKKRLKNHYKRQRFAQCGKLLTEDEVMKFEYIVVIDFEATCSESNDNFVHEIIEFPAVLVDTRHKTVCSTFQRYCKPRRNPKLTDFCTKLTGISQQQVDNSKDFIEVYREFEEWLILHKLGTEFKFAILTDGPWDMSRFLKTQTELSGIKFPQWAKHWINLRKSFTTFYSCGRVNLHQMLDELGMKFEGRPHCGLDDARNIAAIAVRLMQDGCVMKINEHYREGEVSPRKSGSPAKSSRPNSCQAGSKNKASGRAEVEQEGENLHELLEYLKLQKS